MKLQSMTGFSRSHGEAGRYRWAWELRSVNGKSLDVRLRLPPGFDHIETAVRKLAAERFTRGNLQVGLSVTLSESRLELVVNDAALAAVTSLKDRLGDRIADTPLTLEGLLGLRGIAEFREVEEDDTALEARDRQVLDGLEAALVALAEMRAVEGAKLADVLFRQIDRIETLAETIENDPARSPEEIAARLADQVSRLVEAAPSLDSERLYAEAVLLATKADLREEIDRLYAHVAAARELIAAGEPCGRKLDFLAQEFNREANTICSKSNSVTITAAGLELKTVIDQLREQVQNLE
ncbi:YicC/YloC family endoribonuclease [Martelella endophytica]|uniref:YicC family protein n=1 Tax=Martelella endophytica TaxID=1486262 RepID=A0A0D5LQY7_MAREN|nr:YicC/YloC family endoribonuclease [Martelella endophytica]AJY46639.1 hypothetical protein TM49_14660 [Martelella endophytica]